MDDTSRILTMLGPIGVFCVVLLGVLLWVFLRTQGNRQRLFHGENTSRLETIELRLVELIAETRAVNGRLARLETWQLGHEKQDDERWHLMRGALHIKERE